MTVQLLLIVPLVVSFDVTVIVEVPTFIPCTPQVNPLGVNLTLSLFADHVTSLLVASDGVIEAVNESVLFNPIVFVASMLIFVTALFVGLSVG